MQTSGVSLHFEKHKANDAAVNGLQRHNERVQGQKHSNENIKDERTQDNIFLKKAEGKYNKVVADIIENNRDKGLKGVRKDAVRMVEATVQISGKVLERSEDEQEQVLRDSYEWLKNQFGEENIVSAVIHKDETNMHLHFDFVPIENNKLTAKTIISKNKLLGYQSNFLKDLQDKHPTLDFERGGGMNGLSQDVFEKVQAERKAMLEEVEEKNKAVEKRKKEIDQQARVNNKQLERGVSMLKDEREQLEAEKEQLKADRELLEQERVKLQEIQEKASETILEANKSILKSEETKKTNSDILSKLQEYSELAKEERSLFERTRGQFLEKLELLIDKIKTSPRTHRLLKDIVEKHEPITENSKEFENDVNALAERALPADELARIGDLMKGQDEGMSL